MNKEQWNQFVIKNGGSFLQSWQWGEFQELLGRKIWRMEKDNLKGLIIKYSLPFKKNYLYCPRGPVGDGDFKDFIEEIKEIAKKEKSIFLKVELNDNNFNSNILKDFNFIKSQKQIQPTKTVILDLSLSEEELLNRMHQKTRYNLKLAQRKGVIIREEDSSKLDVFLKLSEQTAKRDNFGLHSDEYYLKMVEALEKEGLIKIFLAEYDNKVIAINLVCFFGNTVIYLHGASDYNYRNLMAPYLLQWQTILKAKEKGFMYYDFWGIDQKKWPGVTRFKDGFNGQEINYPDAFDLVFSFIWYKSYNLIRKTL